MIITLVIGRWHSRQCSAFITLFHGFISIVFFFLLINFAYYTCFCESKTKRREYIYMFCTKKDQHYFFSEEIPVNSTGFSWSHGFRLETTYVFMRFDKFHRFFMLTNQFSLPQASKNSLKFCCITLCQAPTQWFSTFPLFTFTLLRNNTSFFELLDAISF